MNERYIPIVGLLIECDFIT